MTVGCQVAIVYAVTRGFLNGVPVAAVRDYEEALFEYLQGRYSNLLARIEQGEWDSDDVAAMEDALKSFRFKPEQA